MIRILFAVLLSSLLLVPAIAVTGPADVRPLDFESGGRWTGAGICYGQYRDGQAPGKSAPTAGQLREDLHAIARHWSMLRMYGTESAARVCEIIEEDKLPLRVMIGAWLGTETDDQARASNRAEVDNAIRIANAYPDVVFAINIGNETQVFWSGHKLKQEALIAYLRQAREGTSVPVTTCDDFNFWNRPESVPVADACDFLGLHAYAMWNGQKLVDALEWTRQQIAAVHEVHPDKTIVLCETGWATQVHTEGEQARLIKGAAGEKQQELFYRALSSWATQARQPFFYFEAFDENWKGGSHPDEVEKHWGLYRADRTPKMAIGPEGPEKRP